MDGKELFQNLNGYWVSQPNHIIVRKEQRKENKTENNNIAMMKILLKTFKILIILFLSVCALLFLFQEKLIFFPQKLGKSYQFSFDQKFEEMNIMTSDQKILNGLLFESDSSR